MTNDDGLGSAFMDNQRRAPVDVVKAERLRRGWSVRRAATNGAVSNTTWGRFEHDGQLTDRMRQAVARAFGWDPVWPEDPPFTHSDESASSIVDRLAVLEERVTDLARIVRVLGQRAKDRGDSNWMTAAMASAPGPVS